MGLIFYYIATIVATIFCFYKIANVFQLMMHKPHRVCSAALLDAALGCTPELSYRVPLLGHKTDVRVLRRAAMCCSWSYWIVSWVSANIFSCQVAAHAREDVTQGTGRRWRRVSSKLVGAK